MPATTTTPPRAATRTPSATEVAAWHAVGRSYHRVEAALHARLAVLNLNVTTHEVMQHLLHTSGLSQQRLAARVFTVKSHLSGIVRDLEERSLITRTQDPTDARAWQLALTPKGKALAKKALAAQTDLISAMCEGVSAQDIGEFARVLHAIEGNLIRMNEQKVAG
jgi:DNA-binding MarR family transcriptional regulator